MARGGTATLGCNVVLGASSRQEVTNEFLAVSIAVGGVDKSDPSIQYRLVDDPSIRGILGLAVAGSVSQTGNTDACATQDRGGE